MSLTTHENYQKWEKFDVEAEEKRIEKDANQEEIQLNEKYSKKRDKQTEDTTVSTARETAEILKAKAAVAALRLKSKNKRRGSTSTADKHHIHRLESDAILAASLQEVLDASVIARDKGLELLEQLDFPSSISYFLNAKERISNLLSDTGLIDFASKVTKNEDGKHKIRAHHHPHDEAAVLPALSTTEPSCSHHSHSHHDHHADKENSHHCCHHHKKKSKPKISEDNNKIVTVLKKMNTECLYGAGLCQVKMGQLAAASESLRDVLLSNESHTSSWKLRGTVFRRMGAYALAELHFKRALDLSPSDEDIKSVLPELKSLLRSESSVLTHNDIVSMHFQQIRNLHKNKSKIDAAKEAKRQGQVLFTEGFFNTALVKYKVAVQICDVISNLDDECEHVVGTTSIFNSNSCDVRGIDDEIGDHNSNINAGDNHHRLIHSVTNITNSCLLNAAMCLLKLGRDYDVAVSYSGRVILNQPRNVKALYLRGISLVAIDKFDDGFSDLKRAIKCCEVKSERDFLLKSLSKLQFDSHQIGWRKPKDFDFNVEKDSKHHQKKHFFMHVAEDINFDAYMKNLGSVQSIVHSGGAVSLSRHYVSSIGAGSSFASLISGQLSHGVHEGATHLPNNPHRLPTLGHLFSDNGYTTAFVGIWPGLPCYTGENNNNTIFQQPADGSFGFNIFAMNLDELFHKLSLESERDATDTGDITENTENQLGDDPLFIILYTGKNQFHQDSTARDWKITDKEALVMTDYTAYIDFTFANFMETLKMQNLLRHSNMLFTSTGVASSDCPPMKEETSVMNDNDLMNDNVTHVPLVFYSGRETAEGAIGGSAPVNQTTSKEISYEILTSHADVLPSVIKLISTGSTPPRILPGRNLSKILSVSSMEVQCPGYLLREFEDEGNLIYISEKKIRNNNNDNGILSESYLDCVGCILTHRYISTSTWTGEDEDQEPQFCNRKVLMKYIVHWRDHGLDRKMVSIHGSHPSLRVISPSTLRDPMLHGTILTSEQKMDPSQRDLCVWNSVFKETRQAMDPGRFHVKSDSEEARSVPPLNKGSIFPMNTIEAVAVGVMAIILYLFIGWFALV